MEYNLNTIAKWLKLILASEQQLLSVDDVYALSQYFETANPYLASGSQPSYVVGDVPEA